MTSPTRTYRWMVAIALVVLSLVGLSLVTPRHAYAWLSHAIAPPFPDRAEHAARHNPTASPGDHYPTNNLNPTRRVGARDEGKAAAERRWVGASPEYVWDGEVLAWEMDTESGPRAFVHEPGGFEPILQQQGGETYLCVNDHLGMPKELIDGEGNLAWAAAHSAYGAVIATAGPADVEVEGGFVQSDGPRAESPFRLLGQVNDPDADLCWTRFRCFDAETGTWISTDPLEINGGLNLYGLDGSPSDVVDPLGLATDGKPHRHKPRIEDGNEKEGWQHIDERHVTGNSAKGPGDLFAPGTSRAQLQQAANKVVAKGKRVSDPEKRIQTFEKDVVVNGKKDTVQVVVDSHDDNRVITMFPARGGG